MLLTIPNFLGLTRILAAPVVAWLLWQGQYQAGFWVFLLAGLTDAIDGPIARHFGTANTFGLYFDPIADKLFINTLYIALWFFDFLPLWIMALVFIRDFAIAGTTIFSKIQKRPLLVDPLRLGKINTGLQIALIALVLVRLGFNLPLRDVIFGVMYIMAATTVVSGAQYFIRWVGLQPGK